MTLRQANYPDTHSTDAAFRVVCQSIHDNFAAMGLVQTADTGQIDLTTVLRPTVASTIAGYEIWRFNDALQSTSPIFFKFEYGTAHVNAYGFFATTGSGSDGTGTITVGSGTVTTRRALYQQSNGATGIPHPCYFDYLADGTGFGMMYWPAAAITSSYGDPFFAIERFRNADGAANADGWNVFYASAINIQGSANCDARFSGTAALQPTTAASYWPVPVAPTNTSNTSTTLGTTMYPIPVFTGAFPRIGGPSQLLLAVGTSDLNAGANVVVSHYGSAHTWVAAGPAGTGGWGYMESSGKIKSFIMRAD